MQEHDCPEDLNPAADSAIFPILGSVGSMGRKASIKSLRCPVLKELHGIAPLRSNPASGTLRVPRFAQSRHMLSVEHCLVQENTAY